MLEGPLGKQMMFFSIPIALTQILQQLFNAADLAVVGRFVGKNAMAAVGANNSVVSIMVSLFFGISVGANVVIAHLIGSGRKKEAGRAAGSSIIMALLFGLLMLVIGELLADWILSSMGVPAEVMDMAVLYLRVYLIGMPVILLYNFESAIFRAAGDTRTPLISLTVSGVINVVLNVFFVAALGMTVDGVAWATVISNVVSSAIMFVRLYRNPELRLREELKKGLQKTAASGTLRVGLPAGLQGVVFSVSNIIIQSAVNSLGADIMAASAAAFNVEVIAYYIMNCFGQTCVTYIGQNHGAGNNARCRDIMRIAMQQDLAVTVAVDILLLAFGHQILAIFNTDPVVISYGYTRMMYLLIPGVFDAVMEVISGVLRGYGRSLTPALIAVFGICGVRIAWVFLVFPRYKTFEALLLTFGVSWVITAAAMIIAYAVFIRRGGEGGRI
jgi:putative MATE family efflux protein